MECMKNILLTCTKKGDFVLEYGKKKWKYKRKKWSEAHAHMMSLYEKAKGDPNE